MLKAEPNAAANVWELRTWYLLLSILAFRLIYLAIFPLGLVADEAYYWDWSRQLDWGYYSKPPLIAWIIALSTNLGGSTELFVRLPAALCSTLSLVGIYLLAKQFYDARVGFWAVVIAAASPAAVASSLLMTIDAPFLCCWTFALLGFWKTVQSSRFQIGWWLLAVLSTGLGLLAKQTMVTIFPLALFFLLICAEHRRQLFSVRVWSWVVTSCLFLLPVVYWNYQHDWITLQHTQEHFGAATNTLTTRVLRALESLVAQMGIVSPITWFGIVATMACSTFVVHRLKTNERFLWVFGILPLGGVFVLTFLQRVQPNWPAPYYIAALILFTAWSCRAVQLLPTADGWATRPKWAAACGLLFCLATYAMPWIVDSANLSGSKLDPLVRLRGWDELGQKVGTVYAAFPNPDKTFVVVASSRTPCGALAFYIPQRPTIHRWHRAGINSQYGIWGGPKQAQGHDAMIISGGKKLPQEFATAFDLVVYQEKIVVPIGNGREHSYHIWYASNFQQWPEDQDLGNLSPQEMARFQSVPSTIQR